MTGAKVRAGSLDGSDIDAATLGPVPTAKRLGRITYKTASVVIAPYSGEGDYTSVLATANCEPAQRVLGGGVSVQSEQVELVNGSYPAGTGGWSGVVFNSGSSARAMTVTAICAPADAIG